MFAFYTRVCACMPLDLFCQRCPQGSPTPPLYHWTGVCEYLHGTHHCISVHCYVAFPTQWQQCGRLCLPHTVAAVCRWQQCGRLTPTPAARPSLVWPFLLRYAPHYSIARTRAMPAQTTLCLAPTFSLAKQQQQRRLSLSHTRSLMHAPPFVVCCSAETGWQTAAPLDLLGPDGHPQRGQPGDLSPSIPDDVRAPR